MPRIFISYRREDSRAIAGRISDWLRNHFGPDSVFIDVDGIPIGEDFRRHLTNTLGRCDVLLALIGSRWLTATSDNSCRRLDHPNDFVRFEIATALKKGIAVVPVLIDRTPMPPEAELPDEIRELVYRQAIDVDAGRDFRSHVTCLIEALEQLTGSKASSDAAHGEGLGSRIGGPGASLDVGTSSPSSLSAKSPHWEVPDPMRTRHTSHDGASATGANAEERDDDPGPPSSGASHAGGMAVSDSVIKGNVTSGSASVGNIQINVGQSSGGTLAAELEYEKCVMLTLRSGGSLESIRQELDDCRIAIGLSIRLAREIEEACLNRCGRRPIQSFNTGAVGPVGPASHDPLTRFFKSASESIASMFSGSKSASHPGSVAPGPPPTASGAVNAPARPGGPPPVPRLAPGPSRVDPKPAPTEHAPAISAATTKEAIKEELRATLDEALPTTAAKKEASETGPQPVEARKPPPLPRRPPPLKFPVRETPGR